MDDDSFFPKVVAGFAVVVAVYVLFQFGISTAIADWLEPAMASGFPRVP